MGTVSSNFDNTHNQASEDDWPWLWAIRDHNILDWRKCIGNGPLQEDNMIDISMAQSMLPVEITPYLFLSDARSAHNINRLKELGITHVLNVAGKFASPAEEIYSKEEICVKVIEAEDEDGYPMLRKHLADSRLFIQEARKSGGKCVVHCVAGINRSGVIVAAEKLLTERMNVLDVIAHIRKQRGNVYLTNETFQEELVALARKEGLLGPGPGEAGGRIPTKVPPKDFFIKR
jgi:atypical dual specificity phosphatase